MKNGSFSTEVDWRPALIVGYDEKVGKTVAPREFIRNALLPLDSSFFLSPDTRGDEHFYFATRFITALSSVAVINCYLSPVARSNRALMQPYEWRHGEDVRGLASIPAMMKRASRSEVLQVPLLYILISFGRGVRSAVGIDFRIRETDVLEMTTSLPDAEARAFEWSFPRGFMRYAIRHLRWNRGIRVSIHRARDL